MKASLEVKSTVKSEVDSLHERFGYIYPDKNVLEISSASDEDIGKILLLY